MTELNHNKSYIVVHKYLRLLGIRISSKTVKDTINKLFSSPSFQNFSIGLASVIYH